MIALKSMMLHMIRLEGYTIRNTDRQVGEHGAQLVISRCFEPKIVAQLMNRKEQRVIRSRPNDVNYCKISWP